MSEITYKWELTAPSVKDGKVVSWSLSYSGTQGDTTGVCNETVEVPDDQQKALADWSEDDIVAFRDGIKEDRGWTAALADQLSGGIPVANWDNEKLQVVSE